jgi:hypothetical protein
LRFLTHQIIAGGASKNVTHPTSRQVTGPRTKFSFRPA